MKRRGLLLDRDGVINEDHGYVGTYDRFVFKAGIFPFLRAAQEKGYRLVVVTNQSGVARGYYTRADYEDLTARMQADLAAQGLRLDGVFACFESEGSFWRKPNPGMILEAALRFDLDLSRSALVGDKDSDMQAGRAAGVGRLYGMGGLAGEGVTSVADLAHLLSVFGADKL